MTVARRKLEIRTEVICMLSMTDATKPVHTHYCQSRAATGCLVPTKGCR